MSSTAEDQQKVAELEERLHLQELIADVSAVLVNLPADEVDSRIEHALQSIVDFLGISRSTFGEFSEDYRDFKVTHSFASTGFEPYPKIFVANELPWYFQKALRNEIIRLDTLSDIPPEGSKEKAYFTKTGLKSQLMIPVSAGGMPLCAIGFGSFLKERSWPDWLIDQLRRVGEIFAHAIYRKQTEKKLKEQIEFERLISDLSAKFVNVPSEQVDTEIEDSLEQLLRFFRIDRCALLKVSRDKQVALVTHSYNGEGIAPAPTTINYVEHFPWHSKKLLAGETVQVNIDQLPPEAEVDKKTARQIGIQSNLCVPLIVNQSVEFVLVANSIRTERPWSEEVISRIHLLGKIFTNTLVRKHAQEDLIQSYRQIQSLKDRLQVEADYLRSEIKVHYRYEDIIGESKAIRDVLNQVKQVAGTGSTVLISGETGTGKELIARAIHNLSPRKNHTMVKVNCASLPPTLIESELFGREKGAYTGALMKQIGRFEVADKSTIFLDEISELSMDLQVKLLRVVQEGELERLGSPKTIKVDVRVIAATNQNLAEAVQQGKFRDDLYYRLNVFPIKVPPLRDRPKDIPLLVMAFLNEFKHKMGKNIDRVPKQTMETLIQYRWPGNIRELRNMIEHAVIITNSNVLRVPFPAETSSAAAKTLSLNEAEAHHIEQVLEMTDGTVKGPFGAAKILGLKPSTLYNKMNRLGILPRKRK